MEEEELIIGIDLGTTNSLVGVVDSGFPILLADENGQRITPSVVGYRDGASPLIGWEALRAKALSPERTISSAKRLLGRPFSDLSPEERETISYPVRDDGRDHIEIDISNESPVTPVDISAEILRHLKRAAEAALETAV